jgi:Lon protease-like protein
MDVPALNFDRAVPLFPLPNCVLFPGVVQPLHIFEPRYREMMAAALGDQRAIAMALLKPGWEQSYYGRPAIYEMVCVGQVVAHERLPDGKFNLLLHGVTRAKVLGEERRGLYRVARLEPCADTAGGGEASPHEALQRKVLRDLFDKTALRELTVAPTVAALFEEGLVGGAPGAGATSRLVDALAFTLVQDVEKKQRLLEELNPLARGELLLQELVVLAARLGEQMAAAGKSGGAADWPPRVGMN